MRRSNNRVLRALVAAGALALVPSVASAQAWVGEKGGLSLELNSDYQSARGVWHGPVLVSGLPAQSLNSSVGAEYIPIDKLALGLTLNTNGARYSGPQTIPGNSTIILAHGTQDDGTYHWNVTDLALEARYQVYDGAVAVTPLFRVRTPVTDYENVGYAAAGSNLREATLGVNFGRYGLGLDNLVLQAGYSFTFVEKESGGGAATEQYRVNRSDADVAFAYVISQKLVAAAGVAFRHTHDGFDLEEYPDLPSGDPLIMWHDPVMQARYLAPTVVASYQISDNWSLAGRFATIVWGRNVSNPISFGLTVGWTTNLAQ